MEKKSSLLRKLTIEGAALILLLKHLRRRKGNKRHLCKNSERGWEVKAAQSSPGVRQLRIECKDAQSSDHRPHL